MKLIIVALTLLSGCSAAHIDLTKAKYAYVDAVHVNTKGFYKNCSGNGIIKSVQYFNQKFIYQVEVYCFSRGRGEIADIYVPEAELTSP